MTITSEEESLERAASFGVLNNYEGADPYDGLLSPFAPLLFAPRLRQLWVQINKRGGTISRKIGLVPQVRMAKTLALFAKGHALHGDIASANNLVDDLILQSDGGPWGYEFDVQTRWAYYRRGTPNVVATTFALRALDATGRLTEAGPDVADWLESLWDSRGYFHYTAASDNLIHNGNLLAAESLCRLRGVSPTIERAVETTIEAQEADGSWPYGAGHNLSWKDNFHTVYVIDSLSYLQSEGVDVGTAIDRAVKYWVNTFFTAEGLPKYFHDSSLPSRDIHNIATSLGALAKYADSPVHSDKLRATTRHLLQFQSPDGGFRAKPKDAVFMRWDQGHAFLALCELDKRRKGSFGA